MAQAVQDIARLDEDEAVKARLRADPAMLIDDADLLAELGLKATPRNVVEFAPVALARAEAAKAEALTARQSLEEAARANFAAQAQTHAAVIDLLDARNHSDLARRVDECARLRFGLAAGALALEKPGAVPLGWRALAPFDVDRLLGSSETARMGVVPETHVLFGERAERVESAAFLRMSMWAPERTAILCFGSADPRGFSPAMGVELVSFLARVVERVAERWPAL